jgi:hypothetical protein
MIGGRGTNTERSAFRRPAFVFAAGLVALCLVATVVLVLAPSQRRALTPAPVPSPPGRVATTAAARGVGEKGSPGSCQALPVASQAVPTVTPATRWVRLGVMDEPSAPRSVGPERVSDGMGHCFAHTPMGALYAAANVLAAFTAAPEARVISSLAAATASKASALAAARVGYNPTLQAQVRANPAISAFSFQSYSPAESDVNIVLSVPSGAQAVVDLSMVWQDGDWRFVVPPGGQLQGAAVTSLDGYVVWGQA